jgi:Histidine kinase-, DNA gyrase B-, and HSP90-like ATPase
MSTEQELVREITENLDTGEVSEAVLDTDERVLARITDGIYRQPASALRELIANAYDADAENVYIQTDAPRFSKISVRDDGNGLTIEALASLIHHIGGSPKRTRAGIGLGVVSRRDTSLTPGGRRLIGKIGIGLFSVAQLTRHFQIITKTKGSSYRLVAEVMLKTYTEDHLAAVTNQEDVKFHTGTVRIQAVPAEKKGSHGTEIILLDLKQQTKDLLRSRETWLAVDAGGEDGQISNARTPPKYHIGRMEETSDDLIREPANLPWIPDDAPGVRFAKLYQAIIDEVNVGESNPKLETLLDNYLRMLWTLSLSAPIDYIDEHPFDLTSGDGPELYELSNRAKGQATKISLRKGQSLRDKVGLQAPERGAKTPFRIYVDEVELKRPIRFTGLPQTAQAIKRPMLFVGKCEPDLSGVPGDIRGGDLSFEGYFLWAPKVVPKENNGVLVRISDASGTLFDESFMKYQISEQTRLRQITGEIFVLKGLDAALNIDRESFNYAHPHYQYLMKWVHNALRQLANMHKQVAAGVRVEKKKAELDERTEALERTVEEQLRQAGKDPASEVSEVVFAESEALAGHRSNGAMAFDAGIVFAPLPDPQRKAPGKRADRTLLEDRIRGVAKILEAYGVFENMTYERQQELLRAIVAVFAGAE